MRLTVFALIIALMNFGLGCTKTIKLSASEVAHSVANKQEIVDSIHSVQLKSGQMVEFAHPGGRITPASKLIAGFSKRERDRRSKSWIESTPLMISIDSVRKVTFKKRDPTMTALVLVGVIGLVGGLIAVSSFQSSFRGL